MRSSLKSRAFRCLTRYRGSSRAFGQWPFSRGTVTVPIAPSSSTRPFFGSTVWLRRVRCPGLDLPGNVHSTRYITSARHVNAPKVPPNKVGNGAGFGIVAARAATRGFTFFWGGVEGRHMARHSDGPWPLRLCSGLHVDSAPDTGTALAACYDSH
jgi:hypothetical protein